MTKISYKIYVKGKLYGTYRSTKARQAALERILQDKTLKSGDITVQMSINV